jgi:outer membrane immunogenic protein
MRRLAFLLLSTVAFAGLSADANAQSAKRAVYKAPVVKAPPPASSGSGFYIGVNAGYGWNRAHLSDGVSGIGISVPTGMAGLTFGYNAQSGAVVYGLETDFDGAWNKGTNRAAAPCPGCETGLTYFGTVRGRLGYAVCQALPYFTGGLAYGEVKTGVAGGPKDRDSRAGWTVGAGVEYALGGAWSAKTEYLYFELGRATCQAVACIPDTSVKLTGNLLRAGLNYRF